MRGRSCIVVLGLAAAAIWAGVYLSTPGKANAGSFSVARGDGVEEIIDKLSAQGIVRSRLLFKYALARSGLASKLQPGTYDLRQADTYEEIVKILATGGVAANEFVLLIKEGEDLNDIKKTLESAGYERAADFFHVTGLPATDHDMLSSDKAPKPDDFSADFPFLDRKPDNVSLEGFLFPDTYRIYKHATPEELVTVLLKNFSRRVIEGLGKQISASGRSLYDVVTMASVIELEVRSPEDRRMVSDIFWRRLEEGMRLQADSTVNYVTGKSLAAVSYDDTQTVSRYNTYKYPGLPLGPICNPGLDAIKAAIEPKANPYWYFLTDKQGNVHYARNLDEHNENKARYLK